MPLRAYLLTIVSGVAAVSLLASLNYLIRTATHTTPEALRHWTTASYLWNAVLYPDRLTPRGRTFRNRFNISLAVFIVSIIALRFL